MTVKSPKYHSENPETKQFFADCGTQIVPRSKDGYTEITDTLQTPIKKLSTSSTFSGHYQVIEELGKGGIGKIYVENRCKDFKTGQLIKLKFTENHFGFESEVTFKLFKIEAIRIFELGVSYAGHTHNEDKKMNWRDGFRAFNAMLKNSPLYCLMGQKYICR